MLFAFCTIRMSTEKRDNKNNDLKEPSHTKLCRVAAMTRDPRFKACLPRQQLVHASLGRESALQPTRHRLRLSTAYVHFLDRT